MSLPSCKLSLAPGFSSHLFGRFICLSPRLSAPGSPKMYPNFPFRFFDGRDSLLLSIVFFFFIKNVLFIWPWIIFNVSLGKRNSRGIQLIVKQAGFISKQSVFILACLYSSISRIDTPTARTKTCQISENLTIILHLLLKDFTWERTTFRWKLILSFRNFFDKDPGHWNVSRVSVGSRMTLTITDPESHAHLGMPLQCPSIWQTRWRSLPLPSAIYTMPSMGRGAEHSAPLKVKYPLLQL